MHPELLSMLVDQVTHAAYLGQDRYGTPTFGSATVRPARVEYTARRYHTAQGEEKISRALIYLPGEVVVTLRDQMTLSDGTAPQIQRIETWTDPDTGQRDHVKVYL